ncbi:hypothetical protein FHG87_025577 [Trinorchestia longiramus]|nr:hypothetical protein FHG87_025577 [Trinorchestia longiramus]
MGGWVGRPVGRVGGWVGRPVGRMGGWVGRMETQIPRPPVTDDFVSSNVEELRTHVYQVCVCPNGRLFLGGPHSICAHDEHTCR